MRRGSRPRSVCGDMVNEGSLFAVELITVVDVDLQVWVLEHVAQAS